MEVTHRASDINRHFFSSRFTDSKKYEEDFLECFKLASPRQGEICNACVLLVKRWKKLPAGSGRNWQHVSKGNLVLDGDPLGMEGFKDILREPPLELMSFLGF